MSSVNAYYTNGRERQLAAARHRYLIEQEALEKKAFEKNQPNYMNKINTLISKINFNSNPTILDMQQDGKEPKIATEFKNLLTKLNMANKQTANDAFNNAMNKFNADADAAELAVSTDDADAQNLHNLSEVNATTEQLPPTTTTQANGTQPKKSFLSKIFNRGNGGKRKSHRTKKNASRKLVSRKLVNKKRASNKKRGTQKRK